MSDGSPLQGSPMSTTSSPRVQMQLSHTPPPAPPASVASRPGRAVRLKLKYPVMELEPGGAASAEGSSDKWLVFSQGMVDERDALESSLVLEQKRMLVPGVLSIRSGSSARRRSKHSSRHCAKVEPRC